MLEIIERNMKEMGKRVRHRRLYHDLPFNGLEHLRHYRKSTRKRVDNILGIVDVKDKTILDIGCGPAGISFGLIEAGATSVVGIDYDYETLQIAKEASKILGYDRRIDINYGGISLEWAERLPSFDIILWLSQWHWYAVRNGFEAAIKLLFEVSKKGKVMIFEASSTNMGEKRNSTQDDLMGWLYENTVYQRIEKYPPVDDWGFRSEGIRNIFKCSEPLLKIDHPRKAGRSIIERIDYNKIKKIARDGWEDKLKIEAEALKRLEKFDHFPKLLKVGKDYIIMTYVGNRLRKIDGFKDQALEILNNLKEAKIVHRDIRRKNFLTLNNKLYLIDFGAAEFDNESAKSPHGLSDEEMMLQLFHK